MSSRTDAQRLVDVLEAIAAIRGYEALRGDGITPPGVIEDAVKYRLVEIGEAVKDLSDAIRDSEPGIPWSRITGMRNLLAHRYHAIDVTMVWTIVDTHLGPLEQAAHRLRAAGGSDSAE